MSVVLKQSPSSLHIVLRDEPPLVKEQNVVATVKTLRHSTRAAGGATGPCSLHHASQSKDTLCARVAPTGTENGA